MKKTFNETQKQISQNLVNRANSIRFFLSTSLCSSSVECCDALWSVEDAVVVVVVGGGGAPVSRNVGLHGLHGWGEAVAIAAVSHEKRVLDDDATLGAGQT